MNNYQRNIEILCKQHQLDMSVLADKLRCDISDLFRPKPDTLIALSKFFQLSIDVIIKAPLLKLNQIKDYPIKMLVIDVDGVMTKAEMIYTENGDELKIFHARDGMGIKLLKKEKGLLIGIISHSVNTNIIAKRKKILDLDFAEVNNVPKADTLKVKCKEYGIDTKNVMYIGDDVNDVEAMKIAGIVACPADAVDEVKSLSHIVLTRKGGDACVRELIDTYLR